MEIIIDPEFKDYLGALDGESRQALEESLKLEGCRDGLVIWRQDDGTAILLDGHNRHELCTKNGIDFYTTLCPETVVDRKTALAWIVENQRARRNLPSDKLAYLRGRIYEEAKVSRGGDRKSGGEKSKCQNDTLIPPMDAAERVAKEFNVSRRTVLRNAKFAQDVDSIAATHGPEAKADVLAGRKKVSDFIPVPVPAAPTVPAPSPEPAAEMNAPMSVERMRAMSDSDCVRYLAEHTVIPPDRDCGAVAAPFPLPENSSENMADPEVARRAHESLDFALCELRRHIAGAETAIKRQRPDAEACVKYRNRIETLIDDLQDVSDLLI